MKEEPAPGLRRGPGPTGTGRDFPTDRGRRGAVYTFGTKRNRAILVARGSFFISTALALAWIGAAPALLAQAPPAASADAAQRDVQQLAATLNDNRLPQETRDEAARRLALRSGEEAREVLRGALRDLGNRGAQLAAARAAGHLPQPDPSFITPLAALLGEDRALTEAGATALADFKGNPDVFRRLKMFADNRAQREGSRIAVIRAIGTLVDKKAAELLMSLLTKADEAAGIRAAAAEALVEMTGLAEFDRDTQRWRQWWELNGNKPDAEWKNDLLHNRSARFDQLKVRHQKLIAEIKVFLKERYKLAGPDEKTALLMQFLADDEPVFRVVGAEIVRDERGDSRPTPPEAQAKLRDLVRDSATEVRFAAAWALQAVVDPAALDALLAQLAQEPDPDVAVRLAYAVAPLEDVRAIPVLTEMLNHSSYRAAEAAAVALGRLGPKIAKQPPPAARQLAATLREVVERTATDVGAMSFREAAVEAMVPLKAQEERQFLARLAGDPRGESQRVRRAAVEALGNTGVEGVADTLAEVMRRDPDAPVRLAAVRALGLVGGFDHAETLWTQMEVEPDPSVTAAIWRVLESLFPAAPKERLFEWAHRLRDDPERQLAVWTALVENLQDPAERNDLAAVHQNIGEANMRLRQAAENPEAAANFAREAADHFRKALDHRRALGAQEIVTRGPAEQLMEALLASRQYAAAAALAADSIRESPENHQTMGSKIWHDVEQLHKGGDAKGAMELIEATKTMDPPLAPLYAEYISKIEEDIRRQIDMEKLKPSGNLVLPHSASLDDGDRSS